MYVIHTWNDVNNYTYKQYMFKIHLKALSMPQVIDQFVNVNRTIWIHVQVNLPDVVISWHVWLKSVISENYKDP